MRLVNSISIVVTQLMYNLGDPVVIAIGERATYDCFQSANLCISFRNCNSDVSARSVC